MARPIINRKTREWYSVSVDALRAWGMVLVVVALSLIAFLGYRAWESRDLQHRSAEALAEARTLMLQLQERELAGDFANELASAVASLGEGTNAYAAADFAQALDRGRRSGALLQSILDASDAYRGGAGQAQFISVEGRVEYRRGDSGEWQSARSRGVLQAGDHVRTSGSGSAEILFTDGTLYTARPDTQLIVSRARGVSGATSEQAVRMDYGWVDLNTARRGGTVSTPNAEARLGSDSEATVTYDAGSRVGRFAAVRGALEVATAAGDRRQVGELEQLVARGDVLAAPEPLLPAPILDAPEDSVEVDLGRTDRLVLSWQPVAGARAYALQVGRSHLFVDNLIDVTGRRSTRATLGVRGEGSFLWRVAALGEDGDRGAWSAPRGLRVAEFRSEESAGDGEPPRLELEEIKSYGSIFIVGGRTEPGVAVEINGELVQVEADGSFTKTIQISKEGWSFIEVRARDAGGDEAVVSPRVFVEIL